jgi:hypothetical protein
MHTRDGISLCWSACAPWPRSLALIVLYVGMPQLISIKEYIMRTSLKVNALIGILFVACGPSEESAADISQSAFDHESPTIELRATTSPMINWIADSKAVPVYTPDWVEPPPPPPEPPKVIDRWDATVTVRAKETKCMSPRYTIGPIGAKTHSTSAKDDVVTKIYSLGTVSSATCNTMTKFDAKPEKIVGYGQWSLAITPGGCYRLCVTNNGDSDREYINFYVWARQKKESA